MKHLSRQMCLNVSDEREGKKKMGALKGNRNPSIARRGAPHFLKKWCALGRGSMIQDLSELASCGQCPDNQVLTFTESIFT
jgi:hypothetical protein